MSFVIFLIVLLVLWMLMPAITRWLRPLIARWFARRVEKAFRRAAGMPPPPSSGAGKKTGQRRQRKNAGSTSRRHSDSSRGKGPAIPPEYAVDVEYTEIREYSSDRLDIDNDSGRKVEVKVEEQVSDAQWVEIKTKK